MVVVEEEEDIRNLQTKEGQRALKETVRESQREVCHNRVFKLTRAAIIRHKIMCKLRRRLRLTAVKISSSPCSCSSKSRRVALTLFCA